MSIGGRSRLFIAGVALLAPVSLLVTPPALAAGRDVIVVDLPTEVRAQPRVLWVVGRTDDGHIVFNRENDPQGSYLGGSTQLIAAPNGSTETLDARVEGVVGNRLVQPVGTTPTSVISRLVSDSSWSHLAIPDGATYLDYSSEGVLVATGASDSRRLEVLPWDGGSGVLVDGLPAGASVWGPNRRLGNGSLSLLYASTPSSSNNVVLLVDGAAHQAWTVNPDHPDCQISSGELWAVNDRTLVWQSRTTSGRQLCTTAVPAPGGTGVAEPTTRLAPTLPQGSPNYDYRFLPVGDEVLVSLSWLAQKNWGSEPGMPLVAVDPSGTARTIRNWAYGVLPTTPGHVLAVTGDAPGQERMADIDVATGTSAEVLAVDPVPAWYSGIAVDGDRVVYADNSASAGGVRQRTVDFGNGTTASSTLLDSDTTGPVAAGAGATAWSKSGWQGRYSGHLASGGTPTYSSGTKVTQTDDRWVMFAGGLLQDTTTGEYRHPMSPYSDPVLLDGVTYGPGTAVPGGPRDSVIATDAATGQAASIPVPSCASVYGVQVAGFWMLVNCTDTAGNAARLVVDRTGATQTWRLSPGAEVYLGNGFAVARDGDGVLSWTPLAVTAPDWQPLGTANAPDPPRDDWAVAVSRGDEPTVAWFSGRSAHVALLPVATTPLPAHPAGVVPPTAPSVNLVAVDQQIRVYWDEPVAAEHITHYDVRASPRNLFATRRSGGASVDGTTTAATVSPLSNGATYDVTVTAWNIAGKMTSTTVSATPMAPPAAPTGVEVDVDPVTSRATVSWAFTPVSGTEPVRGFSVWAGGTQLADVPPDSRSANFVVPQAWTGVLEVQADGLGQYQYGTGRSGTVSFPGLDTIRPKAGLGGIPKVSLTHGLALTLTASDDRRLATGPVDVRWRTARLGQRLGSWMRPPEWQRISTRQVPVRGLVDGQTACFSVRAHDAVGNLSAWTGQLCTAVALDDRVMTRSSGTGRITGARYYRGTATVLGGVRTSLLLSGLVRNTGWLIASTGPTHGRVRVLVGSTSYGSVNLRSASPHDQRLLPLPGGVPQTGRLTLIPVRNGQRIVIDGVALLAH